jgi:hypothetical protein
MVGLASGSFEGEAKLTQIGLFEMRRLEALSNTIFGVAMTLLACDLPKASRFTNAPALAIGAPLAGWLAARR